MVGSRKHQTFSTSWALPSRGTMRVGIFGPRAPGGFLPKCCLYSAEFIMMHERLMMSLWAASDVTWLGRKSGVEAPEATLRAVSMSTWPSVVVECEMSSSQLQKPSSFTCKAAQSKHAGPEGTAGLSGPAFVLAPHAFALTYKIMWTHKATHVQITILPDVADANIFNLHVQMTIFIIGFPKPTSSDYNPARCAHTDNSLAGHATAQVALHELLAGSSSLRCETDTCYDYV
jgi:hypothetical protein